VKRDGVEVRLTPKEYGLLILLSRHAGRVVTHRTLLTSVWGPAHVDDLHYLRVFIGQVRNKIERDPTNPSVLHTERGSDIGLRSIDRQVMRNHVKPTR
jgi:two-component system KDP operon response regulator KdpE